ncbi:MAG: hypothetical protein WAM27_13070 [Nitrososphaeraceae archaeon]
MSSTDPIVVDYCSDIWEEIRYDENKNRKEKMKKIRDQYNKYALQYVETVKRKNQMLRHVIVRDSSGYVLKEATSLVITCTECGHKTSYQQVYANFF